MTCKQRAVLTGQSLLTTPRAAPTGQASWLWPTCQLLQLQQHILYTQGTPCLPMTNLPPKPLPVFV